MSKPSRLTQVAIGDTAPSTGPQPTLVGANGRIRAIGTRGALVAGGPLLEGRMLKSTTVTNQTLTADQLVGGHISFADNAGAAATITMPTVAEIFTYLTRELFAADGDPTTNVNATTLLSVRSIPVTSFRCTFSVGTGNVPTLSWASGVEYYPRGPGNAPLGGTTFALTASTLLTFEFFTIQSSSVVSPRIGFYLVWSVGLGGAYVAPNWAAVLAVGNTSGAFNPTIDAGQRLQFTGGVAVGGNAIAAIPGSASAVAVGGGASTLAEGVAIGNFSSAGGAYATVIGHLASANGTYSSTFGQNATASALSSSAFGSLASATFNVSTAIGAGATCTAANQIMLGIVGQTVTLPGDSLFVNGIRIGGNNVAATAAATSVAIGSGATTGAFASSVALGAGATANAANQIVLGTAAEYVKFPGKAKFVTAVSIGGNDTLATSTFSNCVAIGNQATSTANGSIAIGDQTVASGTSGVSLGAGADSSGNYSIVIGYTASTTAAVADGIAVGRASLAGATSAVAIGQGTVASGIQSTSVGGGANISAAGVSSTALGYNATVTHGSSVALGTGATTTAANQIMMGTATETVTFPGKGLMSDTALGTTSTLALNYLAGAPVGAATNGSVVVDGTNSRLYARIGGAWKYIDVPTAGGSSWANTLAVGNTSGAYNPTISTGQRIQYVTGVSIGGNNLAPLASVATSVTIGGATQASGTNSIAIGTSAAASGTSAIAFGLNTIASGNNSTALGVAATTGVYTTSTALGSGATCTANDQVMIGTATTTVVCPSTVILGGVGEYLRCNGHISSYQASGGVTPSNILNCSVVAKVVGSTDVAGAVTFQADGGFTAWTVRVTFGKTMEGAVVFPVIGPYLQDGFHDIALRVTTCNTLHFDVEGEQSVPGPAVLCGFTYHVIQTF